MGQKHTNSAEPRRLTAALPREIWLVIYGYSDLTERYKMHRVCKQFRQFRDKISYSRKWYKDVFFDGIIVSTGSLILAIPDIDFIPVEQLSKHPAVIAVKIQELSIGAIRLTGFGKSGAYYVDCRTRKGVGQISACIRVSGRNRGKCRVFWPDDEIVFASDAFLYFEDGYLTHNPYYNFCVKCSSVDLCGDYAVYKTGSKTKVRSVKFLSKTRDNKYLVGPRGRWLRTIGPFVYLDNKKHGILVVDIRTMRRYPIESITSAEITGFKILLTEMAEWFPISANLLRLMNINIERGVHTVKSKNKYLAVHCDLLFSFDRLSNEFGACVQKL